MTYRDTSLERLLKGMPVIGAFILVSLLLIVPVTAAGDHLWNVRIDPGDNFHSNEWWLRPWNAGTDDGYGRFVTIPGYGHGPIVINYDQGPYRQVAIAIGGVNWVTYPTGDFFVSYLQDHQIHAWTYLYVDEPKTIVLPQYNAGGVPRFFLNYQFDQPLDRVPGPITLNLHAGENRLDFTIFDQNEGHVYRLGSDLAGQVDRMSSISRQPPVAVIACPTEGLEGQELTFDAGDSSDPDGTIVRYDWTFGDGGTATGTVARHTYADDGAYTVTLTVTNDGGLQNSKTRTVRIENVAPTLSISGDGTVDEGGVYTLALGSTDPGADTIGSWRIDWGDGTEQVVAGAPSSVNHVFADGPAQCTITASATDEDGTYPVPGSVAVTVQEVAPVLSISGESTVDEGHQYTLVLDSTDPGDDSIVSWTINWGDGNTETVHGDPSSVTHAYADGTADFTIEATATDEDGTYRVAGAVRVRVNDVGPSLRLTGPSSVDEGSRYSLSLESTDPGDDSIVSWTIDWGDGTVETVAGNPSLATHTYGDGPSVHAISGKAKNEDGTFTAGNSIEVTVRNVAPGLSIAGETAVDEGGEYRLALGADDPGTDTVTSWRIDWGDGTVDVLDGNPPSAIHVYADGPAHHVISATASDEDGTFAASPTIEVTVLNVAPLLASFAPVSPLVRPGEPVRFTATFTDPGADTHTASFSWGDGTGSAGIVDETSRSVSGTKTYVVPGLYPVALTLQDDDGASASMVYEYVVVYDPSGAFVTGAGSFVSPAGSYLAAPALGGPAHVDLVAKYRKDATVPDGHLQFRFPAADLTFQSTALEWLVVAGSTVQLSGTGTVNRAGDYRFLLTAIDGESKGADLIRVRIENRSDGTVILDTQPGAPDTADPTTLMTNGNLVVHR